MPGSSAEEHFNRTSKALKSINTLQSLPLHLIHRYGDGMTSGLEQRQAEVALNRAYPIKRGCGGFESAINAQEITTKGFRTDSSTDVL